MPTSYSGDIQYVSRLVRLARHFVPAAIFEKSRVSLTSFCNPLSVTCQYVDACTIVTCIPFQSDYRHGKFCLLPFDKFYEKNGRENMNNTTMVSGVQWALSNLECPYTHTHTHAHTTVYSQ